MGVITEMEIIIINPMIWIALWWLVGLVIICAALWRGIDIRDFDRITLGDLIAVVVAPLVWPVIVISIAIENNWLDAPVFDTDWFRKKKDEATHDNQ